MGTKEIEFIASCQCGDTPSYAKEMYNVLHHKSPVKLPTEHPKVIVKDAELEQLINELSELPGGKNASDRLKALKKAKRKYAMFFQLEENGKIRCMYNLLTGNEVK